MPYSVEAELTLYSPNANPTVTTAEAKADIFFDNPCEDPFTFAPTAQTNPDSDNYSGEDIVFTLNQFSITPNKCKVEYECTSIVRVADGDSTMITCDAVNFDGIINY